MPPFIVTLGTFGIAQSVAMVLTQGNSVTGLPAYLRWFNDGASLGIPVPIWATVAVFAATYLLLYRTKFGRYVFAIGGNRRALDPLRHARARLPRRGLRLRRRCSPRSPPSS